MAVFCAESSASLAPGGLVAVEMLFVLEKLLFLRRCGSSGLPAGFSTAQLLPPRGLGAW